MKATWSDRMRKVVWADPDFKDMAPELDEDGGIGTHSNRKFAADLAVKHGYAMSKLRFVDDGRLLLGNK
jgi:hypothetical protein